MTVFPSPGQTLARTDRHKKDFDGKTDPMVYIVRPHNITNWRIIVGDIELCSVKTKICVAHRYTSSKFNVNKNNNKNESS